jgi:outer membrane PBP1 activator LpoA protein
MEGAATELPLVALNFPETDASAPANMLATALSLEVEAQQMVRLALAEFVGPRGPDARPRVAVVAGPGALERRIAAAFVAALRAEGEVPRQFDWTPGSAVVRQFALPSLEAIFLALPARDAAQIRAFIPRNVQVFGTSLVSAGDPRNSPDAATLAHDLEGVRFVDMPWLLEPDHAGALVYPQPAPPLPLEQARLYAFGIDAYRVALAWLRGERRFDVDGVTGRLRVDRGASPRVQRTPLVGTYRGGELRRVDVSTR